jgi:SNF2 family DNA or RNA helicase
MRKAKNTDTSNLQIPLNFDAARWPEHARFPLNKKVGNNTLEELIYQDIEASNRYLVVTGFTSLSNLVDYFGSAGFERLEQVRILIGFEPNIRGRRKYQTVKLDKEIKEYWLKKGLSIMSGGAVMRLIQKIDEGIVEFKYRDKLHAKIYVGDAHAVLGSSNFSKNGLTTQEEANIRVHCETTNEQAQYEAIKLIAESYYDEAYPYSDKIKELLQNLIQQTSWEEALARAIAELLEGEWLSEYKDILEKLKSTSLWPTQWKGLAQAVSILQRQSNVLIADPTGAGKTKLSTSLVLALKHWLYQLGKNYSTDSLVICPPLVVEKWRDEFRSLKKIDTAQISRGLLSNSHLKNKKMVQDYLDIARILTIDEAHNYLSATSQRTKRIKSNNADYKILVTATPISKKIEDLLRLIDLLDPDNLSDENFKSYSELVSKPQMHHQPTHIEQLRNFISQFTVRRTKKALNAEIDKEPEHYKNKLGKTCRFPKQIERIYNTKETEEDIELAAKINNLASGIKGVTYLGVFNKPKFEITNEESIKSYIDKRIISARALSIYMIRSALRSSNVALVEHIEGTEAAMAFFRFKGKTHETGNKLQTLEDIINSGSMPKKYKLFQDKFFPTWLTNKEQYLQTCRKDLEVYSQINELAKKFSGKREQGKVEELVRISKKHNYVLAFDSTVISLYYLNHIFSQKHPGKTILVASGSEQDKDSRKVIETFNLTSESNNKSIALCSDKMSESIDLQKASAVVLLDMPSVLRVVEQRIGRADRMDSLHEEIEIYWPKDSEVFSLKADRRLVQTNELVQQIYGTNFNVPEELKEKLFENVESVLEIIEEYKDFVDKDDSWSGVTDSFQPIIELKEGKGPLIDKETYENYKGVESSVRTRVSFLESDKDWCFIALRGEKGRSPKWYFIDGENNIQTEFPGVCKQLRKHIQKKSTEVKWSDQALNKYVSLFKEKEIELLPYKKRRAIEVARFILEKNAKRKDISLQAKEVIESLLQLVNPNNQFGVDYELLADEWIVLLQPYLNEKREAVRRKKTVLNLSSLKQDYKKFDFSDNRFAQMLNNAPVTEDIDSKIASCIIGVASNERL